MGGLRLRHVPLAQKIAQFDLTLSVAQVREGSPQPSTSTPTCSTASPPSGSPPPGAPFSPPRSTTRRGGSRSCRPWPRKSAGRCWGNGRVRGRPKTFRTCSSMSCSPRRSRGCRKRSPRSTAEERWTYRELAEKAAAVAAHLRSRASGRKIWWGSAWSGASICWRRSWACSRPEPRTCRSIRRPRRSGGRGWPPPRPSPAERERAPLPARSLVLVPLSRYAGEGAGEGGGAPASSTPPAPPESPRASSSPTATSWA